MRFYGKHGLNDTTACWIEQKIRTKNPIDLYSIHFFFLLSIGYFGLNKKEKQPIYFFVLSKSSFLNVWAASTKVWLRIWTHFIPVAISYLSINIILWIQLTMLVLPFHLFSSFPFVWYFVRFFSILFRVVFVMCIPDVTIGDIYTLRLHVKAHLFDWNATASNGPDCWIVNNVRFFFTNQINMDNHFKCIFLLLAAILYTYIYIYYFMVSMHEGVCVCVYLCVVLYLKGVFVIFFFCEKGYKTSK